MTITEALVMVDLVRQRSVDLVWRQSAEDA
jgi:hypothetical protein